LANNSVAIPATVVSPVCMNPLLWYSAIAACWRVVVSAPATYPARGVLLQRRQDRPAKRSALHVGMHTHPLHFANLGRPAPERAMATTRPWTVPTRNSLPPDR
jgi:hypothetical protein